MSPDYDNFNNLRKKIGVDDLDEQARKKMLEKFQKAGGKVDFSLFDKQNKNGIIFKRKDVKPLDSTTDSLDALIDKTGQKFRKQNSDKKNSLTTGKQEKKSSQTHYSNKTQADAIKNKQKEDQKRIDDFKKTASRLELEKRLVKPSYEKEKVAPQSNKNIEERKSGIVSKLNNPSIVDNILFIINGLIFKVLSFNTSKIHSDFLVQFFPFYASTVAKIGYFLKSCFNSPDTKKKVRNTLEKLSPMHYDILHQFLNLADENYLNSFYEHSFDNFSSILNPQELEQFAYYYKKLLFVRENVGVLEVALLSARNIYTQYFRLNISENELLKDISFITNTAYEKFHILLCRNIGKYITVGSPLVKEYLVYDESDTPGYYYKKEKDAEQEAIQRLKSFEDEKKQMIEDDIEKKEISKIPDDVKKGFSFMDEVYTTFLNHQEEFIEQDGILSRIPPNDKVALCYLFYKELSDQYTIFMTMKEVEYKIKFEEHKKVDIKSDLNNILNEFNLLFQDFEIYAEISLKVKIQQESTFYDERLTKDKERLTFLSTSIRSKLYQILQDFLVITMKIIKDYTDKTFYIIANPEDKLVVDEKLHGVKKFNNKPIIYIFTRAYYFIKAWLFRLEKTDLSGPQIYL